jgi:hypothetical protein
MKEKAERDKIAKTVNFAGQKFVVDKEATQKEMQQLQRQEKKRVGGACGALDELVGQIDDGSKNINAI